MKVYQLIHIGGYDVDGYQRLCLHKSKQAALVSFKKDVEAYYDYTFPDHNDVEIDCENGILDDENCEAIIRVDELELED